MSLLHYLVIAMISMHWMPCVFQLVPELLVDVWGLDVSNTWIYDNQLIYEGPGVKYGVALYWSTMTITTIGYGDIVAKNSIERAISIFCMISGATLYAYVVAQFTTIMAST